MGRNPKVNPNQKANPVSRKGISMPYNVEKMIVATICQKCSAKPTKTPLVDFKLPNGLLWVPEFLFCPECGNYVTIQTRNMTEEELKEQEEKVIIEDVDIIGAESRRLRLEGSDGSVIEGEKSTNSAVGDRANEGVITGNPITDALPPLSFESSIPPPLGNMEVPTPEGLKEKLDPSEDVTCDATTQEE